MASRMDPDDDVAPIRRGAANIQDRIAAFAMLDGMKDATQAQKSLRLSLVGFSNAEIAAILQTTPQTVSQNLYEERRKAGGKKPTRKSKAAPAE
jgi:DNA-binding CsgD family transcriptional regulator